MLPFIFPVHLGFGGHLGLYQVGLYLSFIGITCSYIWPILMLLSFCVTLVSILPDRATISNAIYRNTNVIRTQPVSSQIMYGLRVRSRLL